VLNAREAKRRQQAAEQETVRVPVLLQRGTDMRIAGIVASENAIRRDDSPMAKAEQAQRLLDFGNTEAEVAVSLGVEPQTIKSWIALLDLDEHVKKAVDNGELAPTAASAFATLSREDQRTELEKLRAEGKLTNAAVRATVRAKKTGGERTVAPSKKALKKLLGRTDEFSADFLDGVAFAIGVVNATKIKGLTAAMRELSGR
jgi:hypothetical protein